MRVWLALLAAALTFGCEASAQMMKAADAGEKGVDTAANDAVLDEAAQQIGRALLLRCLCAGESLRFDGEGKLAEGTTTNAVDWTLDGVDVQKVSRTGPGEIELDGVRVAIRWNDEARQFQRKPLKDEPTRLTVAGVSDRAGFRAAMSRIASVGIDHAFQVSLPPYWQHYFLAKMAWPAEDGLGAGAIAQAGAEAVANKLSAEYTVEASRDHVAGPVVLQVTVDAMGKPHRVAVVQPLGYGLDAEAVIAAEKTVFAVPMDEGKAAPVVVQVREDFVYRPGVQR